MRTAVDTSVLLDVFTASAAFGMVSRRAISQALTSGALVACDVVWAETRAFFPSKRAFEGAMTDLGIEFDACDPESAMEAGEAWREYQRRGGQRTAMVPDFLVAAHAVVRADRLLTRDRGFTRKFFRRLRLIDPSET